MDLMRFLIAVTAGKYNFKVSARLSLLILLVLSACNPAGTVTAVGEVFPAATEPPATPTEISPPLPTFIPEDQISPYYLLLVTQPDVEPHTIDGVTATIDWVYVDESRVAFHYTISGLDWLDGTSWDASQIQVSSPAVSDIGSVGSQWSDRPVRQGMLTGEVDRLLAYKVLNANEHPQVDLQVEIPLEDRTFQFEFSTPVQAGLWLENLDQAVVVNAVTTTLKGLRLTPSRAEAVLCFEMPSQMGWGLEASTIRFGIKEYPADGGGRLLGTAEASSLPEAELCRIVSFDIQPDPAAASITLTVPRLMIAPPGIVTQEEVVLANRRLTDRGLQFDYVTQKNGGQIVITKRPEHLSDDEIYALIRDALSEQYEGPWVFTVPIAR